MAKAISSEELQLKKRARRRLVGAVALVLFVIVFLPMILDNEPQQMSQDISINLPPLPQEVSPQPVSPEPLHFRPVEPSAGADQTAAARAPARQERKRSASEPKRAVQPQVAERRPAKQTQSAAVDDGFVVQLGAFSNSGNATRLAAKVRENRFKAYTQVVSTTNGERTRVRVGPYPTRAAAEDARERLKSRKLTFGEPTIVNRSE
jgi:DedD protein